MKSVVKETFYRHTISSLKRNEKWNVKILKDDTAVPKLFFKIKLTMKLLRYFAVMSLSLYDSTPHLSCLDEIIDLLFSCNCPISCKSSPAPIHQGSPWPSDSLSVAVFLLRYTHTDSLSLISSLISHYSFESSPWFVGQHNSLCSTF